MNVRRAPNDPKTWYVVPDDEAHRMAANAPTQYAVRLVDRHWYCQCSDFFFRRLGTCHVCKHIAAVKQFRRTKRRQPNLAPLLRESLRRTAK